MKNSAEDVARAFVAAINRRGVDVLTELMTPGHRFVDSLGSMVEGREAVRAAWVGYFRMVPDYRIDVEESYCGEYPGNADLSALHPSGQDLPLGAPAPPSLLSGFALDDGSFVVVMLGVARGTFSPDGKLKPENRWETPVAIRALIVNGKVAEWRVYADNEPIRRLMREGSRTG